MGRKIVILLTLSIAFAIGFASCTKKEAPATPFKKMIGKWKKVKYGTDDNMNGKIEDREKSIQPANIDNEIFFKEDGTGVETTEIDKESSIPLNFGWYIRNGDTVIVSYNANSVVYYHLEGVSTGDLTLSTNTQQTMVWYYYVKL